MEEPMIAMKFKYLKEKRIRPTIIKVKRNSIISSKNSNARNREVRYQTKDYHKWKKKRKYRQRWMAKETAFSSIKRMFGEYTSAIRFQIGKRDDNEGIVVQPV